MPKSMWSTLAPTTRKTIAVRMLASARAATLASIVDELPEETIAMLKEQLSTASERKKTERIKALKSEIANKEKELKELQK